MSSVYFLYRSIKDKSFLKVRFQLNSNKEQFEATTKIHTTKIFWNKTRKKQRNLSGDEKNDKVKINQKLVPLENYILDRFEKESPSANQKGWLQEIVNGYYNSLKKTNLPTNLIEFIGFYIQDKKINNEIKESQIKRITTTKNKLLRIQKEYNIILRVRDIDEEFRTRYIQFSNKYKYSTNTQSNEIGRIKTICRYAAKKGIQISQDLNDLKIKTEKSPKIYLTLDEINKIKKVDLKHKHLVNARDWLLISIHTGQRVSDFMRFTKEMITTDEKKRTFIKFKQIKTGKPMYVPVSKKLKSLLKSLKNEFPKPISDQKYNNYIKEVCREAKIDAICKGKKRICIADKGKKTTRYDYRDIAGDFPKWELISSHIGRRTFATNNYAKIPTPYLIYITGHSTEKEFLNYIVLPDYEKASQAYDHFN